LPLAGRAKSACYLRGDPWLFLFIPSLRRMMFERDEELVAHHEAGHAVVAVRNGLRFDTVTIAASHGLDGELRNVRSRRRDQDERVQVLLAGVIAERVLRGRWPPRSMLSAVDDLGKAHEIASVTTRA
jgi:ATP-dependent Zn protease